MTRFYCFDPDEGAYDRELPHDCAGWIDDDDEEPLLDTCPRCGEVKEGAYDQCDNCFGLFGETAT